MAEPAIPLPGFRITEQPAARWCAPSLRGGWRSGSSTGAKSWTGPIGCLTDIERWPVGPRQHAPVDSQKKKKKIALAGIEVDRFAGHVHFNRVSMIVCLPPWSRARDLLAALALALRRRTAAGALVGRRVPPDLEALFRASSDGQIGLSASGRFAVAAPVAGLSTVMGTPRRRASHSPPYVKAKFRIGFEAWLGPRAGFRPHRWQPRTGSVFVKR